MTRHVTPHRGRYWSRNQVVVCRLLLAPLAVGLAICTGALSCWARLDGWLPSAVLIGLIPAYLAVSRVGPGGRRPT